MAGAIAKRCCVRPWRLPLGEAQIAKSTPDLTTPTEQNHNKLLNTFVSPNQDLRSKFTCRLGFVPQPNSIKACWVTLSPLVST